MKIYNWLVLFWFPWSQQSTQELNFHEFPSNSAIAVMKSNTIALDEYTCKQASLVSAHHATAMLWRYYMYGNQVVIPGQDISFVVLTSSVFRKVDGPSRLKALFSFLESLPPKIYWVDNQV